MGIDRAEFLATFPAIQSAIKIYGDLQGMRVQLDIPESEMAEALKILAWRECVLKVTIEPETRDCKTMENNALAEGPKRKSKWKTP